MKTIACPKSCAKALHPNSAQQAIQIRQRHGVPNSLGTSDGQAIDCLLQQASDPLAAILLFSHHLRLEAGAPSLFSPSISGTTILPLGPDEVGDLESHDSGEYLPMLPAGAGAIPRNPGFVLHLFMTWGPTWGDVIFRGLGSAAFSSGYALCSGLTSSATTPRKSFREPGRKSKIQVLLDRCSHRNCSSNQDHASFGHLDE